MLHSSYSRALSAKRARSSQFRVDLWRYRPYNRKRARNMTGKSFAANRSPHKEAIPPLYGSDCPCSDDCSQWRKWATGQTACYSSFLGSLPIQGPELKTLLPLPLDGRKERIQVVTGGCPFFHRSAIEGKKHVMVLVPPESLIDVAIERKDRGIWAIFFQTSH